jgi:hypothetical protein
MAGRAEHFTSVAGNDSRLRATMATCFLCGCAIPKGTEVRRMVYTGASIGGFNLFSNVVVNWMLKSLLSNRRQIIRSHYSKRTLCPSCNTNIDLGERRKMTAVLLLSLLVVVLLAIGSLIVLQQG